MGKTLLVQGHWSDGICHSQPAIDLGQVSIEQVGT